jgi:hypothetical protein
MKEEEENEQRQGGDCGGKIDLQHRRRYNAFFYFFPSPIFPPPFRISEVLSPISYSLLAFSLGNTGREIVWVCERLTCFDKREREREREFVHKGELHSQIAKGEKSKILEFEQKIEKENRNFLFSNAKFLKFFS